MLSAYELFVKMLAQKHQMNLTSIDAHHFRKQQKLVSK